VGFTKQPRYAGRFTFINLIKLKSMAVRILQPDGNWTKIAAPISNNNESGTKSNNRVINPTDDYTTEHPPKTDEVNASDGEYRKCLNVPILELLSMTNSISATAVDKNYGLTNYRISSADGNTYTITLFINKLWDLILLKLTELVSYESKQFQWDDKEAWNIFLSVKTIADCLGLSNTASSLTHLYDRIVAAIKVLQNVNITARGKKIDGYLDVASVRDCNEDGDEGQITKSNAIFRFTINPELIEFLKSQKTGLYHFNHNWLHLPEHSQNVYAAAKRLGRHYSQETHRHSIIRRYGSKSTAKPEACQSMNVGNLITCLPRLKSKVAKDNRTSLENALNSIPGFQYTYFIGKELFTFEALAKLRLRKRRYNRVGIIFQYDNHPNTCKKKDAPEPIKSMNDDALYLDYEYCPLEDADDFINHKGNLKNQSTKNAN
jgi:hypothetical protein